MSSAIIPLSADDERDHLVPASALSKTRRERIELAGSFHMRDSELGRHCAAQTELDLVQSNDGDYLLVYLADADGRSQIGRLTPEQSEHLLAAIEAGQKPRVWAKVLKRYNEQVSLTVEVEYEPI